MIEHFRRLYTYNGWANREVAGALVKAGGPPRSLDFLAHLLSSERLWLERLTSHAQTHPVWPQFSVEQCEQQAAEMTRLWNEYLDSRVGRGLDEKILYKNSKGEAFYSRIEDVLIHVITHSAYHRGQVATDMRAAGFHPAYTDFIHAVRQGFVG